MTKRTNFWVLVAVTTTVYGAMLGWSLPRIADAASGLRPFDMRPAGYSFDDAQAFLAALSDKGAQFYLSVQHWLDTAYPALLALTCGWAMVQLMRRWRARQLLWLVPLPAMLFDYLENAAVAGMIRAGATGITPEMVADASRWSVLKAGATTVSLTLLLALIVMRIVQRRRARA